MNLFAIFFQLLKNARTIAKKIIQWASLPLALFTLVIFASSAPVPAQAGLS
jgi:hypothetical protein